jgi:type IV pilus assembly protein PilW
LSAHFHQQRVFRQAGGFSLVEIVVGMAIGLLGIIVMLQMLSVSEKQKRSTSGSDDAQNVGAIALYGLQRDIQQSGYGISSQKLMGCDIVLRTGITLNAMAPVTINHGSIPVSARDSNTDTLLVVYGNASGPGEGNNITAQPTPPAVYTMQTPSSFSVGDRVIAQYAARPTPCSPGLLDSVASIAATNVIVTTGVSGIMASNTAAGFAPILFNLGASPKVLVYAVRNGNLALCDYMLNDCGSTGNATISTANEAIWVPIAENIVSMKAEYGRDTAAAGAMDGIVDAFDRATPTTASLPSFQCAWARISAVRIALVARGGSGAATSTAPTWAGSATNPVDLSAVVNWQSYRYKIFQTVVPIRNISMQGAVAGC